jgi:hypothetical protein
LSSDTRYTSSPTPQGDLGVREERYVYPSIERLCSQGSGPSHHQRERLDPSIHRLARQSRRLRAMPRGSCVVRGGLQFPRDASIGYPLRAAVSISRRVTSLQSSHISLYAGIARISQPRCTDCGRRATSLRMRKATRAGCPGKGGPAVRLHRSTPRCTPHS